MGLNYHASYEILIKDKYLGYEIKNGIVQFLLFCVELVFSNSTIMDSPKHYYVSRK